VEKPDPVSLVQAHLSEVSSPLPQADQDILARGRRYGLRDGLCQAVTQGAGEQYLSAFALLLQTSPFQLSILSALPQLIGTCAQLLSVKVLRWFPDRKTLILRGTIGQAVVWLPIVLLPWLLPQWGPWLVIAGAASYFACSHFTTPAWNSFITDLLGPNERGVYFAQRARIMAVVSLLALFLGGSLLSFWQQYEAAHIGFLILFLVAGGARLVSARHLGRVQDSHHRAQIRSQGGFRRFLRERATTDLRWFMLFSGLMHAAVLIAGPFFVIYILRDLQLSYWEYGGWLAASILGQFLTLNRWGHFGDRFGNKALLTATAFMVPFLPMGYLFSTNWAFLMALSFLGGVTWAGLSLGLQNYVFDTVRPEDRAKAVALSNTVNALGWSIGALTGSWLITSLPGNIHLGALTVNPVSNLPFVFFLSGCLRLLVAATLLGTFHEVRTVEQLPQHRLMWELPLLRSIAQFNAWKTDR
jgi:MFS family permease